MTEEEHEMIRRIDEWLFKPPIEGQPTRSEQLDQFLAGLRAGRFTARALLYLCGFVVAVLAAYNAMRGVGQ